MLLDIFDYFFIFKFNCKRRHKRCIPINVYANSLSNIDKRITIEITEDKHSEIKNFCEKENIDMKDFLWLVIEKGLEGAKEHIKELKSKLTNGQNNPKKKIFWIF